MRKWSSTRSFRRSFPTSRCFYIVHLEALMIDAKPFERAAQRSNRERWIRRGLGWSGTIVVCCLIYFGIDAVKAVFGERAPAVLVVVGLAIYLVRLWYAARFPDLELDDRVQSGAAHSAKHGRSRAPACISSFRLSCCCGA